MATMSKAVRAGRLRDICKTIVADPRSVDAGTEAALKKATLQYAATQYVDTTQALENLYHDQEIGPLLRKAVAIVAKYDDGDDDDRSDDADLANHPIAQLAQLLVASGQKPDTAAALHHILNTRYGGALLHRTRAHKAAKESPPMDTVHSIMKDGGIAATCAAIVAKGSTSISEQELVEAVGKVAVERWPELSPSQAFAKIYTASSEEARVLQKAIAIAKAATFDAFAPVQVGGADTWDLSDQSKAVEQLKALGAQKYPGASAAEQFERALVAPENHALARKAVPVPRATTSFPHPR